MVDFLSRLSQFKMQRFRVQFCDALVSLCLVREPNGALQFCLDYPLVFFSFSRAPIRRCASTLETDSHHRILFSHPAFLPDRTHSR